MILYVIIKVISPGRQQRNAKDVMDILNPLKDKGSQHTNWDIDVTSGMNWVVYHGKKQILCSQDERSQEFRPLGVVPLTMALIPYSHTKLHKKKLSQFLAEPLSLTFAYDV